MSRLYKVHHIKVPTVNAVDFSEKSLGSPHPERPQGGVHGFREGMSDEVTLSVFERRERESIRLLEEARRKAEQIENEAHGKAREAYEAGFAQGEKAGEKLALQKIEPTIQTFCSLIEGIEGDRQELIKQYEKELVKVAFAMACEIVGEEVQLKPEVVTRVIERALGRVSHDETVILRIAPQDKPLVEQYLAASGRKGWGQERLTIEADAEIERGGCRVETETGQIEATLTSMLDSLRRQLWSA